MTKENKILNDKADFKIAIIGLGYVGLPLAVEFGKHFETVGFDLNKKRIIELNDGIDRTNEVEEKDILNSDNLSFTSHPPDIKECNFFIVAVPTPLNKNNQPDFSSLEGACELIGECLKPNDTVIFESTVYPGATEEVCVPILERISGLEYINEKSKDEVTDGFFCGYSPERINPGDKERHLTSIKKVTSGSTKEIHDLIEELYKTIIKAGTIPASSIKIA